MNSMTGYGRATADLGGQTVTVQVNSVNRRGLDLSLSLPDDWESFEAIVNESVRKVVTRGKVHVVVDVGGKNAGNSDWNDAAIAITIKRLSGLARRRGVRFEPTTELLWQIANSQRSTSGLRTDAVASGTLLKALDEALRGLVAMRAKEGEALLADFVARHDKLQAATDVIAQRAPQITGVYREQLLARLRQAGLELDVKDERVLKEIALFADRSDISEELTRLRSHLSQLKELLHAQGEIGRKAEFILQEIGREIHTIGSKANDLPIAQQVIEFKNELERVKEQIANVE
jgi:uncharacterized protein (TIGR00255 family)